MTERRTAILAIDEGTSGTRAALVAKDGTISGLVYEPLTVVSPRHAVVEQDADILLEKTIAVCLNSIAQAKEAGIEIIAMAIATQRATGMLWDTQTGKALVPAVVWQDSRYAEELKAFAEKWDSVLIAETGRPVGPRSLVMWAARHIADTPQVTEAWKAGRLAFGTVDTWLLWHLSEERRCFTTPTNASSLGIYALHRHAYLTDWCDAQDFPVSLLPELKQDADDFGFTRRDLLGIRVPIKASCGDQQAGLVGLGCHESGQAMCVHGTGSFVDLVIGNQAPARPGLYDATFTLSAWRKDGSTHYAVESYAATTGSALNWLCNEMHWFDSPKELNELAASAASSGGLLFMPTLTGLRQPRMIPEGRAQLAGLSMAHSRPQLARAVLEGVAHSVVSCADASAEVAGVPIREIIAGGGLSSSSVLLQIQADLSGVPIRCPPDPQYASLRGCSFLAGCDGTMWDGFEGVRKALPEGQVFLPAIAAADRQARRAYWNTLTAEETQRVELGCYQ